MDEAKKQKVMLAILVVAVLGMAAVWLPGLLGGNNTSDTGNAEPRARRVRDTGEVETKRETRTERTEERKEAPTVERRERDVSERQPTDRRRRSSGSKAKEKKKKIIPAA